MNLDHLKDKLRFSKETLPTLLVGFAVIWAVLVLVKVTGFFVASARAEKVVAEAIEKSKPNDEMVKASLARANEIADDLKKDNLFSPPPPEQHPVKEVFAIFGDEVLIKDKWYKVGDTVGKATIVAIGPTSVTTEWNGKEKIFHPIQATLVETSKSGRTASSTAKKTETSGERKENGDDAVTVRIEGGRPGFGGRPGGPGMGFAGMRERIANMSDAERERFRAEMRERAERFGFGGRGGDRSRSFGGRR
ncbi:MAG: hypothetical protein JSW66_11485 [Phycisphaerales bacterium]|nr:MAG: hypothetical protein JSW66_11485 [Phycisphaerales bacterium]